MNLLKQKTSERLVWILDAARDIIHMTGSVGFTMKDVANRAHVAPATIFNLLGSKDGLLYALLSRSLDSLFIGVRRYKDADPLVHPVEAASLAVDLFTSDSVVFRELLLVFLGTRDEVHRPWFMHRSMMFWRHSLEVALKSKRLSPADGEGDDLPRALMIGFIGCVDLWVHGDLDDAGFRAQALHIVALIMSGVADVASNKRLHTWIKTTKRQLPQHHTFLRHQFPPTYADSRIERSLSKSDPIRDSPLSASSAELPAKTRRTSPKKARKPPSS